MALTSEERKWKLRIAHGLALKKKYEKANGRGQHDAKIRRLEQELRQAYRHLQA